MSNILVVYFHGADEFPVRATVWDHLYSFERYAPHRCFYVNMAVRRLPSFITHVKFSSIVFHTTFLSTRWDLSLFAHLMKESQSLKHIRTIKLALPQDEFIHTDILCDFINEFEVDYVFSIFPESEWPKIYHRVNFDRTRFFKVLAGSLDDHAVSKIEKLSKGCFRSIDIGYRAWHAAPWLGRHGLSKVRVAEIFKVRAPQAGLTTDISTRPQDVLLGDKWYRFLSRCKYTIGVPGGSSILDRDGTLKKKTEEFVRHHPDASFEEIEGACFPSQDGSLDAAVITPRHLEACATRTCQVLMEGEYNGILKPRKHYIELRRDFSNIEDVLEIIRQDTLRTEITERAFRDVVASRRYTYQRFVDFILEKSLGNSFPHTTLFDNLLIWRWSQFLDQLSWVVVVLRAIYCRLIASIPIPIRSLLRLCRRMGRRLVQRA